MNLTDVLCVRALKEDVVVTCLRIVLANIFSLWSFQIFEILSFRVDRKLTFQTRDSPDPRKEKRAPPLSEANKGKSKKKRD
mgnify:CR=1 FL=1